MTKRPLVCILAQRNEREGRLFLEARRMLEISRAYSSEGRFVLADGRDLTENGSSLSVRRALTFIDHTLTPVRYTKPIIIDYLYKVANGHRNLPINHEALASFFPTILGSNSDEEKRVTEFTLLNRIRCFAETNWIPTNNSTDLARLCRYKSEADRIVSEWAKTHRVSIPRISYTKVNTEADLLFSLRKRNRKRLDTLLKPDSDSCGNGIAIIKGGKGRGELEERLQKEDIQKVLKRIQSGESYLYCDYLTNTYLIDQRKTELRVNVVPFRREDGEIGVHYAGALVWLGIAPHDPDQIEDPRISLTYYKDKKGDERSRASYSLEETALYTPSFYAALMRSATHVVQAFYNASRDPKPQQALFAFDYLVNSAGEPVLLEVNSRGRSLTHDFASLMNPDGQRFNAYSGEHFLRTLFPEIIHQARQYQQRRQQ